MLISVKVLNSKVEELKDKFARTNAVCSVVLDTLSLLTNKNRFRIICALREGDFCVSELVEITNASGISNISQQLRILALGGIVEKYREDNRTYYTLKDRATARMLDFLHEEYLGE